MAQSCRPLRTPPTLPVGFLVGSLPSALTFKSLPREGRKAGTLGQLTHHSNPPHSATSGPSQLMKRHGQASVSVLQTGGPTVQNSSPLVMVPTPVPLTRLRGITLLPVPCPALRLVHWAGHDLVPPILPPLPPLLRHLFLHSKYSSAFLSLQILPRVLPAIRSRLHCPHKLSAPITLLLWPYALMSLTTPPGPSPPERVPQP